VQRAGESGALVGLLVDLLAWDVNFYTDTHPGDHWKAIVEKQYLGGQSVGTPVWASSGGKVIECEMKRGSGHTVVLSHGNGMATRYYHLSRFARGLKAGKSVHQKEVIGFVGTTGLSTGPHLHFSVTKSVTKNGAFVDPSKVQINRDAPAENRAAFLASVKPRAAALDALDPRTIARN
jgi:murein DD-endopeptidase MepM/ murein hydrolase activator NlpD